MDAWRMVLEVVALSGLATVEGAAASWLLVPLMTPGRREHVRRSGGTAVATFLGVVGLIAAASAVVAQAALWVQVPFVVGWEFLPAAAITALFFVGPPFILAGRAPRVAVELGDAVWRGVEDDAAETRWWFTVQAPRWTAAGAWSGLPVVYLFGVYAGQLFDVAPSASTDAGLQDIVSVTLAMVVLAGVSLVGMPRLLPGAFLTGRLLMRPAPRWGANLRSAQSGVRTPALMDLALRRRERRMPVSQAPRFSAARRVLVDALRMAEGAGHSSEAARDLHRDCQRVALRMAVGADQQAALAAFDAFVVRRGLTTLAPADQPRWTMARWGDLVSKVREMTTATVGVVALAVGVALAVTGGSLADLASFR